MEFIHTEGDPSRTIALLDGMVLVQKLTKKPATVETVKDLSECFNNSLMSLKLEYDEVILDSLRSATREKRRQGKDPIQYQIRYDTSIKHILINQELWITTKLVQGSHYIGLRTCEKQQWATLRGLQSWKGGHTAEAPCNVGITAQPTWCRVSGLLPRHRCPGAGHGQK